MPPRIANGLLPHARNYAHERRHLDPPSNLLSQCTGCVFPFPTDEELHPSPYRIPVILACICFFLVAFILLFWMHSRWVGKQKIVQRQQETFLTLRDRTEMKQASSEELGSPSHGKPLVLGSLGAGNRIKPSESRSG
jgi:hypothetical protein